jgi:hypothetical protein
VQLLAQAVRNAVAHVEVAYPEQLFDDAWGDWGWLVARLEPGIGHPILTQPTLFTPPTGRDGVRCHRLPDVSLIPRSSCAWWGSQLEVREVTGPEPGDAFPDARGSHPTRGGTPVAVPRWYSSPPMEDSLRGTRGTTSSPYR